MGLKTTERRQLEVERNVTEDGKTELVFTMRFPTAIKCEDRAHADELSQVISLYLVKAIYDYNMMTLKNNRLRRKGKHKEANRHAAAEGDRLRRAFHRNRKYLDKYAGKDVDLAEADRDTWH